MTAFYMSNLRLMTIKATDTLAYDEKGGLMNNEELKAKVKEMTISPKVELVEEDGTEKLYLYGSIVDEVPRHWLTDEPEKGDYITMEDVKKAFENIKGDKVEIHLNSKGGDVYTSVAVGNYIADSEKEVTLIVDAIAASGGSIIAMGADSIKMYPNSMMMIHRASAYTYGNADELRKTASSLEKFDESVLASYMNHFEGEKEELKQLIYNETFLTAEECLAFGLCDEIITRPVQKEEKEEVINQHVVDIKVSLLDKYRPKEKTKTNLLNKFKGE